MKMLRMRGVGVRLTRGGRLEEVEEGALSEAGTGASECTQEKNWKDWSVRLESE